VSLRLLAAWLLLATPALAEEVAELDQPAPAFRLLVYNAREAGVAAVGLDRYVGEEPTEPGTRLLVVSFMASWCGPCKKELPALQRLDDAYRSKGLRILAVSIDTEAEGQRQVEALIAANRLTFPVLKDRFNIVARRWLGPKSPLPSLFLVRPDGTVAAVHRGYSQDGVALLTQEVEGTLAKGK
jgi:thiol-disulfide isomerase/thioredoxin